MTVLQILLNILQAIVFTFAVGITMNWTLRVVFFCLGDRAQSPNQVWFIAIIWGIFFILIGL